MRLTWGANTMGTPSLDCRCKAVSLLCEVSCFGCGPQPAALMTNKKYTFCTILKHRKKASLSAGLLFCYYLLAIGASVMII